MTEPYTTLFIISIALLFLLIGYKMGKASVQPVVDRYIAPIEDMGPTDLSDLPDYFNDNLYDPDENREDRIETVEEG